MSTATTTAEAVLELRNDLERLHGVGTAYQSAVELAIQQLAEHHDAKRKRLVKDGESFLSKNKAAFDAHILAEKDKP